MTDANDVAQIEQRFKTAAKKLHSLAPALAHGKQVRAYDGDRRKNLLAKYVLPHLKSGESATAAETAARATPAYQVELEALADVLESAEASIAAYDGDRKLGILPKSPLICESTDGIMKDKPVSAYDVGKHKYWYRFHVGECPVCGRDASYKERVYGRKPRSSRKRYIYLPDTQTYDHCL